MQHLLYVLFQLDEARRYMQDGRLECLRLALLLLDNAAEIQMDRRIQEDFNHDEMMARLRKQVIEIPPRSRPPELQELAERRLLTPGKKRKIDRVFDEKVAFLIDNHRLDPHLGAALKHLHRYRNEAYHRATVRRDTISTAALLLLEINCQMLLTVLRASTAYASDEDYSWLRERFGVAVMPGFLDDKMLQEVARQLRDDVMPGDDAVAHVLGEHLENRLAELYSSLDFIVKSASPIPDRETALSFSQYFTGLERGEIDPRHTPFEVFLGSYSMGTIHALGQELPGVRESADQLEAFRRFSAIEVELEPIEALVQELALQIDEMIQLEVEQRLGK